MVDLFESSSEIPTPPQAALKSVSRIVELFDSSSGIPTPPQPAAARSTASNLINTDTSSGIPTPPQTAAVSKSRGSTRAEYLVHDGHDCLKTLGLKRQTSFRSENWRDDCSKGAIKKKKPLVYSLSVDDNSYSHILISPTKKRSLVLDCPQHSISPTKTSLQAKQNLLHSTHFPERNPICRHHSMSPIKDLEHKKRPSLYSDYLLAQDFTNLHVSFSPERFTIEKKRSASHSEYLTEKPSTVFDAQKKRSVSHSEYLELQDFSLFPSQNQSQRNEDSFSLFQTETNEEILARKKSLSKSSVSHFECLLTDDGLVPKDSQLLPHPLSPTKTYGRLEPRRNSAQEYQTKELSHHLSPEYLLPTDAIQKGLSRKNSAEDSYYSLPIDSLIPPNPCLKHSPKKTIELCPKHLSPQNSFKIPSSSSIQDDLLLKPSNLPPEQRNPLEKQLSHEECLQILPPPLEYSPRVCRHQIQIDNPVLNSSPKEKRKCLDDIENIEISPPAEFSPRNSYRKKEVAVEDQLGLNDLKVPPPPQFSPRNSIRKHSEEPGKELLIEDLEVPPPPQFSPRNSPRRSRNLFWDSCAIDLSHPNIESMSPTRLEQFLLQAANVQSTLVPIKPPKSSLIGLSQSVEKKTSSPVRPRRFSIHTSTMVQSLKEPEKIVCRLHQTESADGVCSCLDGKENKLGSSLDRLLQPQTAPQSVDFRNQYSITAMVSPRQLENNLSNSKYLQPRRSLQDDLKLQEVALSPIWLPKQPLEPPAAIHGSSRTRKSTKTKSRISESLSVDIPVSPRTIRRMNENASLLKTCSQKSLDAVKVSPNQMSLDVSNNQDASCHRDTIVTSPQKSQNILPLQCPPNNVELDDENDKIKESKSTQCP